MKFRVRTTLLGVVLAFILGCNFPCDEAKIQYAEILKVGRQIDHAVQNDHGIEALCAGRTGAIKTLKQGHRFLFENIHKYLVDIEKVCDRGHWDRYCSWDNPPYNEPDRGGNLWHCRDVYICDQWREIRHKKPGYDEGVNAAHALVDVWQGIHDGCRAFDLKDITHARSEIEDGVRYLRQSVSPNVEALLKKAECDQD